jgi:NAD(P)-dependent dehydrogenase (short-subunit alcohol dehydrogenase family)
MPAVLVIGASRGIGLEFALQYRRAGWHVWASARDEAGLQRLREQDCQALRIDVADPASLSGLAWMLDGVELDLVLYVAGVMDRADARSVPTQPDFDRLMRTNVLGAMQTLPQVAPLLKPGAAMAFISSQMGSMADCESSYGWLYRTSKAALNMAVHAAQADYPHCTLLALSPGWVKTEMGGAAATLTVQDSVAQMRRTLSRLDASHRGAFINQEGQTLPW